MFNVWLLKKYLFFNNNNYYLDFENVVSRSFCQSRTWCSFLGSLNPRRIPLWLCLDFRGPPAREGLSTRVICISIRICVYLRVWIYAQVRDILTQMQRNPAHTIPVYRRRVSARYTGRRLFKTKVPHRIVNSIPLREWEATFKRFFKKEKISIYARGISL